VPRAPFLISAPQDPQRDAPLESQEKHRLHCAAVVQPAVGWL